MPGGARRTPRGRSRREAGEVGEAYESWRNGVNTARKRSTKATPTRWSTAKTKCETGEISPGPSKTGGRAARERPTRMGRTIIVVAETMIGRGTARGTARGTKLRAEEAGAPGKTGATTLAPTGGTAAEMNIYKRTEVMRETKLNTAIVEDDFKSMAKRPEPPPETQRFPGESRFQPTPLTVYGNLSLMGTPISLARRPAKPAQRIHKNRRRTTQTADPSWFQVRTVDSGVPSTPTLTVR